MSVWHSMGWETDGRTVEPMYLYQSESCPVPHHTTAVDVRRTTLMSHAGTAGIGRNGPFTPLT